MATQSVNVNKIASGEVSASCPDCREWITATRDSDGVWTECACSSGYATIRMIKAVVA